MKIRDRWIMLLAVSLMAAGLSACGQKSMQSGQAGAGGPGAPAAGSGVEVVNPGSAPAADGGAAQNADAAPATQDNQAEADAQAQQTYDILNQSGEEPAQNAQEQAPAADGWDGTFSGGDGETLTLSRADEYSLSFSFAASGISGTADLEGNYAVYHGDDDHDISFSISGNTVTVAVTLAGDGSAEESPMNGTYTRNS